MRIRAVGLVSLAAMALPCYGQSVITSVAGAIASGCSRAENVPATTACMQPSGIAMDNLGNLYISDGMTSRIRKISATGIITTVAGSTYGYSGDGGAATSAQMTLAGGSAGFSGLAVDNAGNLYISDSQNSVIRMVNAATNIITTIAGNGTATYSGDGGPATKASLQHPAGVALDSAGNVYIADVLNNRVRKVSAGIITTVAGNGSSLYSSDGVQATTTGVCAPNGVRLDSAGNLYISESDRIRKVDTNGIITTLAGKTTPVETPGFSGDGGPAAASTLNGPLDIVLDAAGNLYFADGQNQRIRKINTAGIISTYAGLPGTVSTPLGDGGLATSAYLGDTLGLVLDTAGDLYVTATPSYGDIRKITPGAGLATSPGSLTFATAFGGPAPASQTVSVTSTGAALTFTASASTTSGGNWLSVTPTSGTTTATITVSVNASGLTTGTYAGLVTLTPGGGASPAQFGVTLSVTGAGAPAISSGGIVNATGYQTTLAPDTVFVIFGSNLGPSTLTAASAPGYPASLGGTSIAFTPSSGGASIAAKMIYASAGQVAGLLPSSIAPGTYTVQLTYNNQPSAPQTVTVAARSFGIATANSAGTGAAQATIGNVNGGVSLVRLTAGSLSFQGLSWTLTPAHPGDTLVLWGTGGGSDPANDAGGTSGDQTAAGNFSVMVDGTQITPLYAGASSGYPGLWQINFTLPASMTADCFASLQVSAGGQLSNSVTISIAAAGQSSCSSQISPSTLSKLDSGGTIVMAAPVVGQTNFLSGGATTTYTTLGGVFNQYSAAEFLIPYSGPKFGACRVLDQTYPVGGKEPSAADSQLNAGTIEYTGPGISGNLTGGPFYSATVSALQLGGSYTLTGLGGTQIGAFPAITATLPTSFTVTNFGALGTVTRSQPLTVTWSGTGFDQVIILLIDDVTTGSSVHGVVVSCAVDASSGTYTIPAAALQFLPAGSVQVEVEAVTNQGGDVSAESGTSTAFTPPLAGGGKVDFGSFSPFVAYIQTAKIQ